jgi:hypothetical protein
LNANGGAAAQSSETVTESVGRTDNLKVAGCDDNVSVKARGHDLLLQLKETCSPRASELAEMLANDETLTKPLQRIYFQRARDHIQEQWC